MKLTDGFFKKIENKTSVNKDTILSLAKSLQENNLKNEDALRDVVHKLSEITGKSVSKEKEDKIISTIMNDKVPKNLDKML